MKSRNEKGWSANGEGRGCRWEERELRKVVTSEGLGTGEAPPPIAPRNTMTAGPLLSANPHHLQVFNTSNKKHSRLAFSHITDGAASTDHGTDHTARELQCSAVTAL
jgi:hypothetical protein